MKKRLLSALLALALVFVLLPTTALAGVTTESNYDISIDGKRYKFDSDGSGGYTTAYYQENNGKTPTSNYEDVWQTNPYLEITRVDNIITITVKIGSKGPGKSVTIGASTQDINYECIAVNGAIDLIITGDTGTSLTLNKTYCGAALSATKGNITITDGVKVTASFKNKAVGNYVFYAIWAKNLTVSGANTEVTASGNCEDAIHVSGTVTVSKGAKLTATNDHNDRYKPYPITKSSAINSNVLTIADENSCVIAQAIDSLYGKPLRIQNYNIAGAIVKAGSSNYYSTETTIDKIDGNIYVKISIPALEKDSYVYIAGGPAVVGVRTSLGEGNGYYTYNKDTKTFTLENVNITSVINAIQLMADGTYTINLVGTNTISDVSAGIVASNLYGANDITAVLSGTGSLDITAGHYAIDMQKVGNLKFENTGTIKLTTGYKYPASTCNALYVVGNVTIDKTKYDIKGEKQAQGFPTEDIGNSPVFETILKGTSTDKDLYFKSITITPAAAKPSTIRYNGTTLKQGETITDGNGGTATVDSKNNTITLKNFNGTAALSFDATLADSTLVLEGTNTLSSIVTTQMGLTISGSGSLTVGSIRVPNNTQHTANLTINGGAHVTVNRPSSEDEPAVEVSGNLTVTGDGTQLSAECTAATNPAIEVGGNVTISGNPGTDAYTVKAYNKYATQRGRDDKLRPSQMPSAIEISGDSLSISNSARVMAKTDSDGAAVWMPALKVISVADASLIAQNSSHNFSTISFGDESDMGNIYAKGQVNIVAENMLHSSSSLAHRAIKAFIYNHYSTGDSNPYYINVVSEGVQSGGKVNVIPGHCTSTGGYKVTITRGDAYTTPQVAANYTIAGQTMYVGKYYKTDANGNITDGTAQDYNIYCDSKNDFTLNNATISSTGTGGSTGVIMTNLNYSSAQFHIKLIGTNSINNAGHHAILGEGAYSTIIIENAENASNASLTISGNYLPVYSYGNVTINAEVVIKNTNGNLISTIKGGHANGAFDLGSGYKCYASTNVSGSPLEAYDAAKGSTYKYLRVTKENLAPTTPTPQTPFTIYGIPAQFVDGGMIATTGVTATSSNNINLPIDRVEWYTFTPGFRPDGSMDSVINKTKATGNFEAGKYYVVEIRFVQDLSPFESWDMKVSGWSDNDVSRQSVTARNDIEIYFLTPASAATHEHNWAENYDPVYHWKMCTYDGCTAIKDKALHVWNAWHTSNNEQQHWKSCSECSYSTPPHDIDLAYVSDGEQGHHLYCKHDGCTFVTGTTAHVYAEGSNICTDCGYNKSAPCDHTGDRAYTNNGDGTHKVTCKACGATIVEKQNHEFGPTGACIYCGATQSGGDPTPDNPGTIVIIRPAEEEKPAQQPNPSTGANDLVGLAVAAAVAAALGSAALLRKHD